MRNVLEQPLDRIDSASDALGETRIASGSRDWHWDTFGAKRAATLRSRTPKTTS